MGTESSYPKNSEVTQEFLFKYLPYNSVTGEFTYSDLCKHRMKNKVAGTTISKHPNTGYKRIYLLRKWYQAHRLAWLYVYGVWPDGEIDHVNNERGDNRIENLRVVSRSENMTNSKTKKGNTSGMKGVYWNADWGKWCATVSIKKQRYWLGGFVDIQDAKNAVVTKLREENISYAPQYKS